MLYNIVFSWHEHTLLVVEHGGFSHSLLSHALSQFLYYHFNISLLEYKCNVLKPFDIYINQIGHIISCGSTMIENNKYSLYDVLFEYNFLLFWPIYYLHTNSTGHRRFNCFLDCLVTFDPVRFSSIKFLLGEAFQRIKPKHLYTSAIHTST